MSRAELALGTEPRDYLIAPMTEHDLLEVVEIEEACDLSRWGWEAYRHELDSPEALMLIARRDPGRSLDDVAERPKLSGFIAARLAAGELHVNNIGVQETARGQGIGRALLTSALWWGKKNGARAAFLEVRAANTIAQALYRREGFEVIARRRKYYRQPIDDALVMGVELKTLA